MAHVLDDLIIPASSSSPVTDRLAPPACLSATETQFPLPARTAAATAEPNAAAAAAAAAGLRPSSARAGWPQGVLLAVPTEISTEVVRAVRRLREAVTGVVACGLERERPTLAAAELCTTLTAVISLEQTLTGSGSGRASNARSISSALAHSKRLRLLSPPALEAWRGRVEARAEAMLAVYAHVAARGWGRLDGALAQVWWPSSRSFWFAHKTFGS